MLFLLGLITVIGILIAFIAYWMVMLMIIFVGVVFYFWVIVIGLIAGDPYVGWFGSFIATGLTFWLWNWAQSKKTG